MKRALITGSNRGLGFEFVKQLSEQNFHVIATCRHPEKTKELQQWSKNKENVSIQTLAGKTLLWMQKPVWQKC
ncbi:SDR family NAD(P)-dependent oxidoreductase [Legionella nagasakiensis]|uniref:SDR family NAD(P)-dependent oxidoreductase n=1 Tax=Legionella nagasakiensis TaxID=535290 RepID=UPI001055021B|nr:SDR family NAD(P)-dependent oxidoreductase [Legionella nagasakiensis]